MNKVNRNEKIFLTLDILLVLCLLILIGVMVDMLKTYQTVGVRLARLEKRFNRWVEIELNYEKDMYELSILAEKSGYKNWKWEERK